MGRALLVHNFRNHKTFRLLKDPMPQKTKQIRHLQCELTPGEKLQRAEELARALHDQREHDAMMQTKKAAWKKTTQEIESKISHYSKIVHSGNEARAIECRDEFNWEDKTVETYRMDSGELVDTRPMFEHELQKEMFDDEPNPPPVAGEQGEDVVDAELVDDDSLLTDGRPIDFDEIPDAEPSGDEE